MFIAVNIERGRPWAIEIASVSAAGGGSMRVDLLDSTDDADRAHDAQARGRPLVDAADRLAEERRDRHLLVPGVIAKAIAGIAVSAQMVGVVVHLEKTVVLDDPVGLLADVGSQYRRGQLAVRARRELVADVVEQLLGLD